MRSIEIFEPVSGIWCVRHRPTRSCAYIVKTSPGALVIDTGPDRSASGLMMGLQGARVGLSSVHALVLTDVHADRAEGAAAFHERSGTKVYYSRTATGVTYLSVERFIGDGDLIEGRLEVLATPGPTPGHLSYYLRSHGALFHGDSSPSAAAKRAHSELEWLLPGRGRPLTRVELDLASRTR